MRALRMIGLAAIGMTSTAEAQTLGDAVDAAVRTNPTLESARLSAGASRQGRWQAWSAYLPQATLSGEIGAAEQTTRSENFLGQEVEETDQLSPTSAAVDFQQEVYAGGRRRALISAARARSEGADQAVRLAEQSVVFQVVQSYADVLLAQRAVETRQAFVQGFTVREDSTRRQLDVGVVTRTDLAQTLARQASAESGLVRSLADYEIAKAVYLEIVGERPESLAPLPPPPQAPDTLEYAVEYALQIHPALMQSEQVERQERAQYRVERSALLPNLTVFGSVSTQEEIAIPDYETDDARITARLSIPLFEGGLAWSRMRESRYQVRRAESDTEQVRRQIIRSVTAAWNDVNATRLALDQARAQVDAAQLALDGLEREHALGLRTITDVLDANDELLDSRLNLHQAESDVVVAAYALYAAMGALGEGVVPF